ncbi:hypothetical protein [Sphingomonas oryzagri]
MAQSPTIELRYYPQIEDEKIVFSSIWGLVDTGTTTPITRTLVDARFDVSVDGKLRKSLSLGSGLTYNDDTKQVSITFMNSDVSFIKEDATMEYAFYVVWDFGQAQTIREGAINAVRVA